MRRYPSDAAERKVASLRPFLPCPALPSPYDPSHPPSPASLMGRHAGDDMMDGMAWVRGVMASQERHVRSNPARLSACKVHASSCSSEANDTPPAASNTLHLSPRPHLTDNTAQYNGCQDCLTTPRHARRFCQSASATNQWAMQAHDRIRRRARPASSTVVLGEETATMAGSEPLVISPAAADGSIHPPTSLITNSFIHDTVVQYCTACISWASPRIPRPWRRPVA